MCTFVKPRPLTLFLYITLLEYKNLFICDVLHSTWKIKESNELFKKCGNTLHGALHWLFSCIAFKYDFGFNFVFSNAEIKRRSDLSSEQKWGYPDPIIL